MHNRRIEAKRMEVVDGAGVLCAESPGILHLILDAFPKLVLTRFTWRVRPSLCLNKVSKFKLHQSKRPGAALATEDADLREARHRKQRDRLRFIKHPIAWRIYIRGRAGKMTDPRQMWENLQKNMQRVQQSGQRYGQPTSKEVYGIMAKSMQVPPGCWWRRSITKGSYRRNGRPVAAWWWHLASQQRSLQRYTSNP